MTQLPNNAHWVSCQLLCLLSKVEAPDVFISPITGLPIQLNFEAPLSLASNLPSKVTVLRLAPLSLTAAS